MLKFLDNSIWFPILVSNLLFLLFLMILIYSLAKPIFRHYINKIGDYIIERMLSEKYSQNNAEIISSLKRISILNMIELNLRAQDGKALKRPLGSPKRFPGYDLLMFSSPLMSKFSLPESTGIDMSVRIGPKAGKPLHIQIPLMISGMAYGLALSEQERFALAKAAKSTETAICSGEGPLLPEERQEAGKYIVQISRWPWGGRTDDEIASADMLEVQMGQGAEMGTFMAEEIKGKAQQLAGLIPGQLAASLPAPPGVNSPEDWPIFMSTLRKKAQGIPIGLKLMPTGHLEEDLAIALDLGFDAIVLDGAQGGTCGSTPIKQDDFGIPTLNALVRANRFFEERGVRQEISLITAGGYFTPGECLKALALGADAVYLGSVVLMASTSNQVDKVTPFEPPTTMTFYDSSPVTQELCVEQAATSVANLLKSFGEEMKEGLRALGKASLEELSPEDLVALDTYTAEVTGVRRIY
ncbi:FMN-binding glutamate synthase family protein [Desulfosporosinus hippei]|uniref:Glutamate synthase conserved region-containing protein n=1 Tax=Desulfosporosinus hippei DSM 8344 TaxID=1121419 RepID=A0A1G8G217_9FIRM|nr:FMN-binding glutamate synthase family protein [Desulfosporosinus hippei]SDH88448.1 glutamate synthase conserved region-containing protein [Desulfosporosinus hippei DSM 8344]